MLSTRLNNLNPYKPGEQPKDREYIKLNANENPFSPPDSVKNAINNLLESNIKKLALYADPDATELRQAIADHLNQTGGVLSNITNAKSKLNFTITPEMIFCGNGSDEVLSFVFYAFFDSDKPLIVPEHSYSFYPVYAGFYNINLQKIPLQSDFSLDTKTMLQKSQDSTGMIFANPNAPTGIALSTSQIKEMLENFPKDKVLVVDEAYVDFAKESALSLINEYKNLLIVRTFSKSLSFAGMRLGFAVGNPELISALKTVKNSFNHFPVDAICQTAGKTAVQQIEYYESTACQIVKTREWFATELKKSGYFVIPSETNFVFAKKCGFSGEYIYQQVKKGGILIRHFNTSGIEDFVRITIGTTEQMEALLAIMKTIN